MVLPVSHIYLGITAEHSRTPPDIINIVIRQAGSMYAHLHSSQVKTDKVTATLAKHISSNPIISSINKLDARTAFIKRVE